MAMNKAINNCKLLENIFKEKPNNVAIDFNDKTFSFREIIQKSKNILHQWNEVGLIKGSNILILPNDRLNFFFSILAASIGGFNITLVNDNIYENDLDSIIKNSGCDFIYDPTIHSKFLNFDNLFNFTNINIIFFTSGTTGQVKGFVHSLETLLSNSLAFNSCSGIKKDIRMLNVMPIGYMASLLNTFFSPLIAGGVVILYKALNINSALNFWRFAFNKNINSVWLSPTMLSIVTKLCRDDKIKKWASSNLKYVFIGMAPLHYSIRKNFYDLLNIECYESYGMTECMFITVNPISSIPPKGSVGKVLNGVEISIRDDNGQELKNNNQGNIFIKSDFMYLESLSQNSLNSQFSKSLANDWLDTGDKGYLDDNDNLSITGRTKDIIIRGGVNINPRLIEEVLLLHPLVRDAAVIGIPHSFWGEEIVACIITKNSEKINSEELFQYCSNKLTENYVPSYFQFLDKFPLSISGKIKKILLKKTFMDMFK